MYTSRNNQWSVGLMDKASAPGAGDSRLESWADQMYLSGGYMSFSVQGSSLTMSVLTMARTAHCCAESKLFLRESASLR